MERLTEQQIVLETIKYYRTHKRGYDPIEENCRYFYNNTKCAVGRCLIDPKKFKNDMSDVLGSSIELEKDLKPQYKGHDGLFWANLQDLHDTNAYWDANDKGGQDISEQGKYCIKEQFDIQL